MATDTMRQRDPYHLTFPPTHRRQIQPKRRRHAIRNGSCEHGGARERDKLATVASRWKDCRFTPRSGCKRPAPIKTRHRFIRQAVAIVVTFYHSFTTIAMSVCLQVIPATYRDDSVRHEATWPVLRVRLYSWRLELRLCSSVGLFRSDVTREPREEASRRSPNFEVY